MEYLETEKRRKQKNAIKTTIQHDQKLCPQRRDDKFSLQSTLSQYTDTAYPLVPEIAGLNQQTHKQLSGKQTSMEYSISVG